MPSPFVSVTVAILASTTSDLFTFNAPLVSMFTQTNAPASGSSSITLLGASYCLFDASVSGRIGGTSHLASTWISVSSTRLKVANGMYSSLSTLVSLQQTSSQTQLFSYDASVVSSVNLPFTPSSGSVSVTMFGRNYGSSGYSAAGRLHANYSGSNVQFGVTPHRTSFLTTTWISQTSVQSRVPLGTGRNFGVVLSVGVLKGSITNAVSYLNPAVRIVVNATSSVPSTAISAVTISGQHFGISGLSVTARIAPSGCQASLWIADSSVVCKAPSGSSILKSAVASSWVQQGELSQVISYIGASVSSIVSLSVASTGGVSVTIAGFNILSLIHI